MVNKVEYMKLLHSADLDVEPPKQRHETRKRIWDAYTAAVCNAELSFYKTRKERSNGHNMKLVRYFTSTDTRQMFARVMVKALINKSPTSAVDVASQLVITYKSATTMIKECLDTGWVEEPSAKLYQASDELLELFQEFYVKETYRQTLEIQRLRNLVTEYEWFLHNMTDLALES